MDDKFRKLLIQDILRRQYELANAEELDPDERLVVYGKRSCMILIRQSISTLERLLETM